MQRLMIRGQHWVISSLYLETHLLTVRKFILQFSSSADEKAPNIGAVIQLRVAVPKDSWQGEPSVLIALFFFPHFSLSASYYIMSCRFSFMPLVPPPLHPSYKCKGCVTTVKECLNLEFRLQHMNEEHVLLGSCGWRPGSQGWISSETGLPSVSVHRDPTRSRTERRKRGLS